jgi:hypothetical protein
MLPLATIVPLVFGGLMYMAFRPTTLLMFGWFDHIGASPFVAELRIVARPLHSYLPDWAVYSFPQAAWVWFGTMALLQVSQQSRSSAGRVWVLAPCLLAVGGEVGQRFHLVPGTFDVYDIVFSMLAVVAALWFHHCFREHQQA